MDAPLFSVIIPTYGRQVHLTEAVESVLAQTVRDFECIVVDDASSEPAVVPSDPRVRLVRREVNGGPSAGRNSGLAVARGRYVAFLDDDELFTADRLEYALEGLGRADVALCWRRSLDDPRARGRILEGRPGAKVLEGEIPHVGVVALERLAVLPFDERLRSCEDVEWWVRLAPGRSIATVPKVGCMARERSSAYFRSVAGPRADARLRVLELHDDFFATHGRAAAFQWRKLGFHARSAGDHQVARRAFARSVRRRPSLRTMWHLITVVKSAP